MYEKEKAIIYSKRDLKFTSAVYRKHLFSDLSKKFPNKEQAVGSFPLCSGTFSYKNNRSRIY